MHRTLCRFEAARLHGIKNCQRLSRKLEWERAEDEPLLRVGHNSRVIHSQPRREYLQMGFKSGRRPRAAIAAEYRLPTASGSDGDDGEERMDGERRLKCK